MVIVVYSRCQQNRLRTSISPTFEPLVDLRTYLDPLVRQVAHWLKALLNYQI